MGQAFRIALGNCSCKNPNLKQGSELQKICKSVEARIEVLKKLHLEQLRSLPSEEEDLAWVDEKRVVFYTIKEEFENNLLIVVRAFMPSWKWPTFLSLQGVGHVVAEGIIANESTGIVDAPEEYLWDFR